MAKLSIDIGVNLGEATRQLGKLNSSLISLNSNAEKLVSTLKQIGKINIKPTVGIGTSGQSPNQAAPKQVPNVFEQYTQGASSASNITDLLEAKLEQLVARSNELKQTLAGGIGFMTPSSSLEELKQVENQIKNVQGLLKSQSFNIIAPKNVPDIFKDFRSGASGAATAIDFLRQREQELISQSNTLRASLSSNLSAGGFQQTARDIKQVEDELKKVQALIGLQPPDIFADFKSGAIQASTAFEFLEIKEQELIQESLRLKNALKQAGTGEEFIRLQNELNKTEKELNDVTRALNSQRSPLGGVTSSYGSLNKSASLANLSLTNVGRVFQDLPFGMLGIANNITPLIESFVQLRNVSIATGVSMKAAFLSSLAGPGGLILAVSALTAVMSFASVGFSYWARESKKAKDENDKFAESLDKAKASALSTGLGIQRLIAQAKDSTLSIGDQRKALNEANEQLSKYNISLTESDLKNGKAEEAVKKLTLALIQQAIVSKQSDRIAEFLIERETLTKNAEAAQKKLNEVTKAAGSTAFQGRGELFAEFQGNVDKANAALDQNTKNIEDTNNAIENATKSAAKFLKIAQETAPPSRKQTLEQEIKDLEARRLTIRGTYGEESKQYKDIIALIKVKQDELDKILGTEKKSGEQQKTTQQKVADLYKKINAELNAINARRDLNPLEKATQSAEALKSALGEILQLDIKQLDTSQFKELETKLKGFEEIQIRLEVSKIKEDLETTLESLRQRGSFFNIDTTKDQIKAVETAIDKLYDKFQDKKVSPFEKQSIFLDIAILQSGLRQLNLDSLVKSGENAFKDLTIDVEKLNQKKILLGVDIGKEGLTLVKKAIDTINEKKIELLSEKDPVRAAQLNDELNKAQGVFSQFRSVAIGESFKEYQESARGIREEFERTSKFLTLDKKLKLKIETDKKLLQEVTSEIEEQFKLGISPLDPRIIFARIEQTKLRLQIEADTESLESIQNQIEAFKAALTDAFADVGESIGTALSEGANVGEAIGKTLLENLGEFLQVIGKQFIAGSKLVQAAKIFFGTQPGILAGVALVALGALIKGFAAKGFAEGGFVSGPGSDRSDSIPARLSNGEFVVNARSVRKYGRGFMEMVNSGSMPITNYQKNFGDLRFADGGIVSDARGVSRAIVNRSDFGGDMGGFVAETKISGQDLRLVLKRADSNYSKTT